MVEQNNFLKSGSTDIFLKICPDNWELIRYKSVTKLIFYMLCNSGIFIHYMGVFSIFSSTSLGSF